MAREINNTFIRYVGSKRKILPVIAEVVEALPVTSILDAFSGSCRVAHYFKEHGYRVEANDMGPGPVAIAAALIDSNLEDTARCEGLLATLNMLQGVRGYFTESFCEHAKFWSIENGMKADAIREKLEVWRRTQEITYEEFHVCLLSLIKALDRVDSSMGFHQAFIKKPPARFYKPMVLVMPNVLPWYGHKDGPCRAWCHDAANAMRLSPCDVVYMDPPYTGGQYSSQYHVWDTLALWDKPEHYGVVARRVDAKTRKSEFSSKVKAAGAMQEVIEAAQQPFIILSYSSDAIVPRNEIETMLLSVRPDLVVIEKEHRRYAGSHQGVYDDKGKKVGKAGELKNTEYIFVAGKFADDVRSQLEAIKQANTGHTPSQ